jgi:hypothetical protein
LLIPILVGTTVADSHDVGPLASKAQRTGSADAAGRSCDHGNLAL